MVCLSGDQVLTQREVAKYPQGGQCTKHKQALAAPSCFTRAKPSPYNKTVSRTDLPALAVVIIILVAAVICLPLAAHLFVF